jgi:hypothetical protein
MNVFTTWLRRAASSSWEKEWYLWDLSAVLVDDGWSKNGRTYSRTTRKVLMNPRIRNSKLRLASIMMPDNSRKIATKRSLMRW